MRVAALYDIHGMVVPLDAVLAEVEREGVDLVVVGGDVVPGPEDEKAVARLRALGERCAWIRGNGEREADGDLAELPERLGLEIAGLGRVLFCHATPRSDEEIVTPLTSDERLAAILEGVHVDVVVAGHTHIQEDRRSDGVRWVNAGSVGMPYEGEVAAFWALLSPEEIELRRTPFDIPASVAALRASGWESAEEFIAGNLLGSVSREEAAAHFESLVQ